MKKLFSDQLLTGVPKGTTILLVPVRIESSYGVPDFLRKSYVVRYVAINKSSKEKLFYGITMVDIPTYILEKTTALYEVKRIEAALITNARLIIESDVSTGYFYIEVDKKGLLKELSEGL